MSISLRLMIPINPPRQGNCPVDNLPNELLSYVFRIGVEIDQRWWDKDLKLTSYEDQWVHLDGNQDSHGVSVKSGDPTSSVLPLAFDFMPETFRYRGPLPPQVLVSHVCRRWRAVALNIPRFWTTLRFCTYPGLAQKQEYISRSNGFPLTIEVDCGIENRGLDNDTPAGENRESDGSEDDEVSDSDMSGDDETSDSDTSDDDEDSDSDISEDDPDLSLEDLGHILNLLEPVVSQWGRFDFYASDTTHILFLMSRLDKLSAAPCLTSFRIHRYRMRDDTTFVPAARFLPFHGQAPKLKEVIFWGIHIDWEGALPTFLRGLRIFGLSALKNDDRPSYAAFAEIIKNSPELKTLTSSMTGPLLSDDVSFDPRASWVPIPLPIPSLTRLMLQLYDQKYAIAFMQHLDLPNLTHLVLNLYQEDYSDFVKVLAKPAQGRGSLLRKIIDLEITGLSLDLASVKVLLSELRSLICLNLQPSMSVAEVICDALVDPSVLAIGQASDDLPNIFCPNLEEITTCHLDEKGAKALVAGRRDAGVPLKKIRNIIY